MRLISTRGNGDPVSVAQAFVKGLAPDGGLFVPEAFPRVDLEWIRRLMPLSYEERAKRVLTLYLGEEYSAGEIDDCVRLAYTGRFVRGIVPLREVGNLHVMELFHGPTCAFKDMALQLFPRLLPLAMQKEGVEETVLILVATSGDTGKAALEGFMDVPGTEVLVFYPEGGVSQAQRLQMVTQRGSNVRVAAVRGNFDDAQNGVKRLFADPAFAKAQLERGRRLSSANSINFGRLLPQVVYYFSAYADLCVRGVIAAGDRVNFAVPTGNFGNILAAWYAMQMGLPVRKLICASNQNNVLTDFFSTGKYDAKRPFYKTTSPSMDILVSSNLERLLFELCDRDAATVREWMRGLQQDGGYSIGERIAGQMRETFFGGYADDDAAAAAVGQTYEQNGYLMDPHTAVGWAVYQQYRRESADTTPTVLAATADPFKFAADVLKAIGVEAPGDDFACAEALEEKTGMSMPASLKELPGLPQKHTAVLDATEMGAFALSED